MMSLTFQIGKASPAICDKATLRAIVGMEKTAYLVTGDEVWEMDDSGGLVQDERQNIGTIWPGLPRYPDAGFTWLNGLQYIFIGTAFSGFSEN